MRRAELNTQSASAGASRRPVKKWLFAAQAALFGLCLLAPPVWAQQAAEPRETSVTADGLVGNLYAPANSSGRLPAMIVLVAPKAAWAKRPAATAG